MIIKLINTNRKRAFNLPCCIFDNFIKVADEAALKVILCLYSSDDSSLTEHDIMKLTGLDRASVENGISFWVKMGELSTDEAAIENKPVTAVHQKINLTNYIKDNAEFADYVSEAETSVGRILTRYEKETLILLLDYYRFSPTAAILIFEHCAKREYFSSKTVEKVAASLYEKGIVTYEQIEQEFTFRDEYYGFESEIKRALGLNSKLSKKQSELLAKWKGLGFSAEMIVLAGDKCLNATNKVAFPYMDKVLESWASKNLFTPEAVEADTSSSGVSDKKEHSYDLNEFDDFSLGDFIKK